MNERVLDVETASRALRCKAGNAERNKWGLEHGRHPSSGTLDDNPAGAAVHLARCEVSLEAVRDLLTTYGILGNASAAAIIVAERKRVREELDAKWLTPVPALPELPAFLFDPKVVSELETARFEARAAGAGARELALQALRDWLEEVQRLHAESEATT